MVCKEDLVLNRGEALVLQFTCDESYGKQYVRYNGPVRFKVHPDTLHVSVSGMVKRGTCSAMPVYFPSWNFSIGLGDNKIGYWIPSAWYLRTPRGSNEARHRVSLVVSRQWPQPASELNSMEICTIHQSCLHHFDQSIPCGLQLANGIIGLPGVPQTDDRPNWTTIRYSMGNRCLTLQKRHHQIFELGTSLVPTKTSETQVCVVLQLTFSLHAHIQPHFFIHTNVTGSVIEIGVYTITTLEIFSDLHSNKYFPLL
ncbi:hypothetical protein FGIG_01972 [Fasciola gigantica]|uniref:Uncharacterized protein n=1 Tax=Fasciola gigantica TaxID=46835 RepID=A0A504YFQ2_FASGI|nr:hypothetical protein FGIG_01972 [Fasciola gigantica]